jgi:hypothetical protein
MQTEIWRGAAVGKTCDRASVNRQALVTKIVTPIIFTETVPSYDGNIEPSISKYALCHLSKNLIGPCTLPSIRFFHPNSKISVNQKKIEWTVRYTDPYSIRALKTMTNMNIPPRKIMKVCILYPHLVNIQ